MSQPVLNVDVGCIIFQYLTLSEAVPLSRTSHFWYNISGRRIAYSRMKFPSFKDEFDILEYRHWQEYDRRKLSVTPRQLVELSTSRLVQRGVGDLELILDSSPYDPHPSPITRLTTRFQSHPYGRLAEEKLLTAISLYQSVVALTITIEPNFDDAYAPEILWICVSHLITHVAPKLISFKLHVTKPSHGLEFADRLAAILPPITMPNLLHAHMPLMIGVVSLEERSHVRWAAFKPIHPKGVLEISSTLYSGLPPSENRDKTNLSLEQLGVAPAHLIFPDLGIPQKLIGHDSICRSRDEMPTFGLPASYSAQKYWSDLLPLGPTNYHELSLRFFDGQPHLNMVDLTPLARVTHSLRILNIEMVLAKSDLGFRMLMRQLCAAAAGNRSRRQQVESGFVFESPFDHATCVRINITRAQAPSNTNYHRIPLEISFIARLCSHITHLELFGAIDFDSIREFPLQQLLHLTTTLPQTYHDHTDNQRNHDYIKNIVRKLHHLQTFHLLLDESHRPIMDDHFSYLLPWSSPTLTEVVFSYRTTSNSDGWFTRDPVHLNDFNQWLIQLHLIWQLIQPTHQLPLDQISLTPIACMVDLLPLLATFNRHPLHQLPYLSHRCQEYDQKHAHARTNWLSRLTINLTSHMTRWLWRSDSKMEAPHAHLQPDSELGDRDRLELLAHLSDRSSAIRDRLEQNVQEFGFYRTKIEPRSHFRFILQME